MKFQKSNDKVMDKVSGKVLVQVLVSEILCVRVCVWLELSGTKPKSILTIRYYVNKYSIRHPFPFAISISLTV